MSVKKESTNNKKNITDFNIDLTEEEINEREVLLNKATEKIKSYGLKWTFDSIYFITERYNVTFNQLRSCVFKNEKNETYYDLIKAVRLIIEAGLVGSEQFKSSELNSLKAKAVEIMEDWRSNFGYIGVLQILLINIMEKTHFFMGTQDLQILELLSYKNLQKNLANIQIATELQDKVAQSQAVQ